MGILETAQLALGVHLFLMVPAAILSLIGLFALARLFGTVIRRLGPGK